MNLKVFTVKVLVSVMIGVFTISNLIQGVMARNNDKCITVQTKDKLKILSAIG